MKFTQLKKASILFVLAFFTFGAANAQKFTFNIKASANTTCISDIENDDQITLRPMYSGFQGETIKIKTKETFEKKIGFKIAANTNYDLGKNFYVKTGVGLNLVRFKRVLKMQNMSINHLGNTDTARWQISENTTWGNFPIKQGQPISHYWMQKWKTNTNNSNGTNCPDGIKTPKNLGNTTILYLDIPLRFGYKIFNNKLKIDFGVTTSFLVYSEQKNIDKILPTEMTIKTDTSNDGLTTVLFSVGGEISYQIVKNISVFGQYNRSLNSMYDLDYQDEKAKYNLLSLGVSFDF